MILALLVAVGIYALAERYFTDLERRQVDARVSLYQSTLTSELDRFQHLPFVLSRDRVVRDGASGRNLDALNERFEAFAKRSNLDAIYLMDRTGLTIAASNFREDGSFLGQNYSFRPYFADAMAGQSTSFFGIGSTTGLPGYFISEPVTDDAERIIGVVALKLSLTPLVDAWTAGGEDVFVSNPDDVIVLSSQPDLLYQALNPLTDAQRARILARQQFAGLPLPALDWQNDEPGTATLNDLTYLHATRPAGDLDWTLHYLADRNRVVERAALSAIVAGLLLTVLLTYAMAARSRRIHAALSASQQARQDLQRANRELQDAQDTLARHSRLAALGQLAASVTHELGQPITALRNYVSAAQIGQQAPELASQVSRIVLRMENITRQLKFFATTHETPPEPMDLRTIVHGAILLVGPDFESDGVALEIDLPDHPVPVAGARLRLEQVLVNLLRNARLAALEGGDTPVVLVRITQAGAVARLSVLDNGGGFEGDEGLLFEPFHSNRSSGEGMGLGLSISYSITKDHGGTLRAENSPDGGAVFTMTLPLRRIRENAA